MTRPTARELLWLNGCVGLVACYVWAGMFVSIGVIRTERLVRSERARAYPTTDAVVIRQDIQPQRKRPDRVSLNPWYRYTVDGREYSAHQYDSAAKDADPMPHAVGSVTGVAYNPADPGEYHFRVGTEPDEGLELWLLFGLASVGLWGFVPGGWLLQRVPGFDPRNPADVRRVGKRTAAALPPLLRWQQAAHIATPAVLSGGFFLLNVGVRWLSPGLLVGTGVTAVGLIAVVTWVAARYPKLVFDHAAGTVSLPSVRYWRKPVVVRRDAIVTVRACRTRRPARSNDPKRTDHSCIVVVAYREPGRRPVGNVGTREPGRVRAVGVAVYDHRHDAEALAAWVWWARATGERPA